MNDNNTTRYFTHYREKIKRIVATIMEEDNQFAKFEKHF